MKKLLLALSLLISGSSAITAFAQTNNACSTAPTEKSCCKADKKKCDKKEGRHDKKKCNKLFKGIELTADQKAKLQSLKESQRKEFEKDKQKMREQREKRMDARDKELSKILTPEQMAVYNANKAEMKSKKMNSCKSSCPADKKGKGNRPHCGKPGKSDKVKTMRHNASVSSDPAMK